MKNKKVKNIVIAIGVILALVILNWLLVPVKANIMFGDKICSQRNNKKDANGNVVLLPSVGDEEHSYISLPATTKSICPVCWQLRNYSSISERKMCGECAKRTGRCEQCGGLE